MLSWQRDTSLNLKAKNIYAESVSPFPLVVTITLTIHFSHSLNSILHHTNVHVCSITDINGINQHSA